jgi:hypothetical protein
LRRLYRDADKLAPTLSSRTAALDAAEKRTAYLKAQLANDAGWLARKKRAAGRRSPVKP